MWKLAKLKAESSSWESSTRVEIEMLSSTIEEGLEYYVRVDVWKQENSFIIFFFIGEIYSCSSLHSLLHI